MSTVSFRCKNCGHMHSAEHAGECQVPAACCVCGAGVEFSSKGVKTTVPANWEVLCEVTPERLRALGLDKKDVVAHAMGHKPETRPPQAVSRTANETLKSADKAK